MWTLIVLAGLGWIAAGVGVALLIGAVNGRPCGRMAGMAEPIPVSIRSAGIRLGQFLKVADAVDQGSDARALLASEAVTVNGDVETRRGRQLNAGDIVMVGRQAYIVQPPAFV